MLHAVVTRWQLHIEMHIAVWETVLKDTVISNRIDK